MQLAAIGRILAAAKLRCLPTFSDYTFLIEGNPLFYQHQNESTICSRHRTSLTLHLDRHALHIAERAFRNQKESR